MKKITLLLSFCILISISPFESFAQLYWGGSGGAWNSAGWSTTNSAPYNTAWTNNSHVVFNVDGTIAAPTSSSNFLSLTCNADVSFTSFTSTIGTNGTVTTIDVASGKTFDFLTQGFTTSASTGFIKNGSGTLSLNGNTYGAGFTLNTGTVVARGVNTFGQSGVNDLNINGGTIAGSGTITYTSNKFLNILVRGDFTLGSTTSPASSTANLTFASPVDLGTSSRTITLNGTGTNTLSGVISGTGGGITTGSGSSGTLILSGANTYTGSTTASGGTLILGSSGVIPDASVFNLDGGTLRSGTTTGFSETFSTINLTNNSTLTLGTGIHSLNFSASNGISWTSGKTLTITGWAGTYNGTTSGTAGKIFFGSNATGLTFQQLSQIKFFNGTVNSDATLLPTGELVPTGTLPISLTSFTAKPVNQTILLNWNTASEVNNNYFDVLRSVNGKSFTAIVTVNGLGDSNVSKDYSFVDENPYAGTNYYQLVQHDFDGKTSSSAIISADSKIAVAKILVFANSSEVKISITSPNQTKGLLQLFDISGRKLAEQSIAVNKGFNSISFPASLQNGVHFIRYSADGEVMNQKFTR